MLPILAHRSHVTDDPKGVNDGMDSQRWKVVGGREEGREEEEEAVFVFRGEEAGESVLEEGGREGGARARASAQMWSWLSCD